MHQASILMTAFVMIMAGAWIAMYELSDQEAQAAPAAVSDTVPAAGE